MHYSNLVIVKREEHFDLDAAVEAAMGPHENDGGFWDFYQIGGRWTGAFDGYDPEKDPANIKVCALCAGSGTRTDMTVANGCNGCNGTGKAVEWPTQWKRHDGDVIPVSELTQEHWEKFHRFVLPDGYGVQGGEKYIPWDGDVHGHFLELPKPPLEWIKKQFGTEPDYEGAVYVAVVVDNHV